MSKHQRWRILLMLILSGEVIFLLPFVIPRIFRPTVLQVFQIDNLELGTCFSIYGLVALMSYFFGGPLADRIPSRTLMSGALILTGIGGFVLALSMNSEFLIYIYAFWGMTTILLFWSPLIRSTREWGGEQFQGRGFGWLEGGRGLSAALIGILAVTVFASQYEGNLTEIDSGRRDSFQMVLMLTSTVVVVLGILVYFLIPKGLNKSDPNLDFFSTDQLRELVKNRKIWLQALIILSAYVGYKATDDYSLYAAEVLDYTETDAARLSSIALFFRPVFAVLMGFLFDKYLSSRTVILSFLITSFASLILFSGILNQALFHLLTLFFMLIGIYGLRGIYFSIMGDAKIPLVATGTAVGLMSVIGYLPDIFMSPWMGYLLDSYPGRTGHQLVFGTVFIFSVIGLLSGIAFAKRSAN